MASPHQSYDPALDHRTDSVKAGERSDERPIRTLRLRLVIWDVICTVAVDTVLVVLLSTTNWTTQLFGFAENVCPPDTCAPVPYGINYYILPVMYGGIGAAISAVIIGPFVSLLKGWYMFFWPFIAIAVVILTSVIGYAMTGFSEQYGG